MIQFRTLFLSVFGLFMMACAREEIIVSETSVQDTPIGMQAQKGRLHLNPGLPGKLSRRYIPVPEPEISGSYL